jgi:DNA-binding NarL/FixJ family response regulator
MFEPKPLTLREREVLAALSRCGTYEEVGAELGVSINTVRAHVRAVYDKLGARSRTEAVLLALRDGVLPLNPGV